MTPEELARILSRMYLNAPRGEKMPRVHLFGIRYADEIGACGASVAEIVDLSALSHTTLATEVKKGVKLARYVSLRPVNVLERNPMLESSEKKTCPECGHEFQGNGWDGIDAHWRSKHEGIMPYEEAWPLLRDGTYTRPVA